MKETFSPDYKHLEAAARNITASRIPLYEHIIGDDFMERLTGSLFRELIDGDSADKKEYFRRFSGFFAAHGYDTVSFECCVIGILPGGGALVTNKNGAIKDMADFNSYPWDEIPDMFFKAFSDRYDALRVVMPDGMKAVGGVGNGVFECVQDLVGFEELCMIRVLDPELYRKLFEKVGQTLLAIWQRFMPLYGDIYCVARFRDDLGFKTNTMLSDEDICEHILPNYKRIISLVHSYDKPFLLHSCGCIFNVFNDIIRITGIDAKHSNEDQIAAFPVWVERYGDKIGNFGGIDLDVVCRKTRAEIRENIHDVLRQVDGKGGIAFGTGNSIPVYVPEEGFLAMVETLREYRGA